MPMADVCHRHGISSARFYTWKSKVGGLEVSNARRLRSLEEGDSRLKMLPAEAMLDHAQARRSQRSGIRNTIAPGAKQAAVAHVREH